MQKIAQKSERFFATYRAYVHRGDDWILAMSIFGLLSSLYLPGIVSVSILVFTTSEIYKRYSRRRMSFHAVAYIVFLILLAAL
jgi:hypothetical protein